MLAAAALAATALLVVATPAAASGPRVDLLIKWGPTARPSEVYSYTITCDPDGGTGETDWYMEIWRACDDLRQAASDLDKIVYEGGTKWCWPTSTGWIRTQITGTSYGKPVNRDEVWADWPCVRNYYGCEVPPSDRTS